MTIVVKEAVSDIAGTLGDAFDGLMVGFDDPDQRALLAIEDPAWSTTPGGILAFGECPQVVGHVGDATLVAHVFVPDAAFCVFGECGAMRLTCTPSGSGWKAGATVFTADGTASLLSDELPLSTSDGSYIAATFNAATGETKLYLSGVEVNDTTFGGAVNRVAALPIWRVGAPPGGWVTDFGLFDRILDPEEMPGYVPPPSVTINQGATQSDPSSDPSIVFDVVFSEAVTGFATGDVTLSGTAGGTLVGTVVDSGDHIHFTVTVTGMTTPGTVIASIAAAVCTSVATGQSNAASTSTDNTVTWAAGAGSALFHDTFTRANSGTVGQWWDEVGAGTTSIASNVVVSTSGAGLAMMNKDLGGPDHWMQWRARRGGNSGNDTEGVVRWNASGTQTFYMGRWRQAAPAWEIYKCVAGAFTQLATTGSNAPVDETDFVCRLEIVGTTINLYEVIAGVPTLRLTTTDNSITTGNHVGWRINRAGGSPDPSIDDFYAGPLPFTAVSVSDNFPAGFGASWSATNWSGDGSGAGQCSTDNAHANWDAPLTDDHYVEVDLTQAQLTTSPNYARVELFARREDRATETYYMARYYGGTGEYEIYKRIAGTFTKLGGTAATAPTLPVRLGFEVNGTTLTVYTAVAGVRTVRHTLTDSSIVAGTICGMRCATGGATIKVDNFAAASV